jgi:protein-tyrosine-phosphatase
MSKKTLILTVCTGNTCRSPMAAKLLEAAFNQEGGVFDTLDVASAGVAAIDGMPASAHSITAAQALNLDLSKHQSCALSTDLLERCYAIFGMTQSHVELLQASFPEISHPIYRFREFLPLDIGREIPDPYGQNLAAYQNCLSSMQAAIPSVIGYLKTRLAKDPG